MVLQPLMKRLDCEPDFVCTVTGIETSDAAGDLTRDHVYKYLSTEHCLFRSQNHPLGFGPDIECLIPSAEAVTISPSNGVLMPCSPYQERGWWMEWRCMNQLPECCSRPRSFSVSLYAQYFLYMSLFTIHCIASKLCLKNLKFCMPAAVTPPYKSHRC